MGNQEYIIYYPLDINNSILIQFGNYNTLSNNTWITITLPTSFTINNYTCLVTQRCDNCAAFPGTVICGHRDRTTSSIKIGGRYVAAAEQSYLSWLTIGY